jgi:hypothetical protein
MMAQVIVVGPLRYRQIKSQGLQSAFNGEKGRPTMTATFVMKVKTTPEQLAQIQGF